MGANCQSHGVKFDGMDKGYKRILILVAAINGLMFLIEMPMGFMGQSQALKADALDFLGDTLTYIISFAVIGQALALRAKAALAKGISLLLMGLWVFGSTVYTVFYTQEPAALIMGTIGVAALTANLLSVILLMRYKDGDANVRSVWLCSRNDAIGNVMVLIAASFVWASGTGWPDLIVASIMAALFISGSYSIIRQALAELAHEREHHHSVAE